MKRRDSIDAIFEPSSVAVIGATPRRGTIGHQILHNIVQYGFNGMLFPVNPKHKVIHSIKCYPSVLKIPDPVDLAIIVVPKEHVVRVARECGRKGVGGLVIVTAGFREVGGEGEAREKALVKLQRQYGFRIIGPNCMGIINAKSGVRLNATFAPSEPKGGSLAFLTQSGALGVAILLAVEKLNLGLSYFVSVGNKVDVGGNDLLEYWDRDEATKVIALYLESFGDPRRFTESAKHITKRKPILLVKSGRTAAGSRAASSHTGHLAGLDIAVEGLLHQCGVLRASSIDEMMDLAQAFTMNAIPKGDRIAVLSNAGGPAIMATDALVSGGLQMADLTDATRKKLRDVLAEDASVRNPVDMIAGAGAREYELALDILVRDPNVDTVIIIFVPPIMVEPSTVMEKITRINSRREKPIFCVMMAEEKFYEQLPREFPDAPPIYRYPESAVRAAADMNRYRLWCERPEGKTKTFRVDKALATRIVSRQRRAGGGYLSPPDANKVLRAYGLPTCRFSLVPANGDIEQAAERVGYPMVLKVHGRSIIHKSEYGGVVVDIKDRRMLADAVAGMKRTLKTSGVFEQVEGFLVQEMIPNGQEVILGMSIDQKFGPVLMFGMGGKYVEVIQDIAFRVMPVTDIDAWEMVRGIRSFPLLEGVRGEKRVDIEFIVESIQRLGQLVDDLPAIAELDLNPVIVSATRGGSRVVDARIRVAGP